jgi:hypothetical protein
MNIHPKKTPTEDRINQDQELHQQIVDLNTQIQDLTSSLNVRSPLLNLGHPMPFDPHQIFFWLLSASILSEFG